jgi:Holliday junction resolvase RusA-like endonuclease
MNQIINIKPLSVNEAWKGKKFKTDKYKRWINDLLFQMKMTTIPEGKVTVFIQLGFSNALADIDNPVKMILDTVQKKAEARGLKFNDYQVYKLLVEKYIVPKGKEYIAIGINPFKD